MITLRCACTVFSLIPKRRVCHRFQGVEHQVQDHLLPLHLIAADRREHGIEGEAFELALPQAAAQAADHCAGPVIVADDVCQVGADLLEVRGGGGEELLRCRSRRLMSRASTPHSRPLPMIYPWYCSHMDGTL